MDATSMPMRGLIRVVVPCPIGLTCLLSGRTKEVHRLPPRQPTSCYYNVTFRGDISPHRDIPMRDSTARSDSAKDVWRIFCLQISAPEPRECALVTYAPLVTRDDRPRG